MDSFESFKYTFMCFQRTSPPLLLWCGVWVSTVTAPQLTLRRQFVPGLISCWGRLLQSLHQIYGRDMGPGHQVTCTIPPHAAHKHSAR